MPTASLVSQKFESKAFDLAFEKAKREYVHMDCGSDKSQTSTQSIPKPEERPTGEQAPGMDEHR